MATAYTPGLTVSAAATIRRARRLPLAGRVVVQEGEEVWPERVVARAELPGVLRTVRAAERLGIDPQELPGLVRVAPGDPVESGQLLAESRAFFGLFRSECRSPVEGRVELVNPVTGHISIREQPSPIEVSAYVSGRVAEVLPGEGVVIETHAALIQGIFGVGGERQGRLRIAVHAPDEPLTEEAIRPEHASELLIGGASLSAGALRRAAEVGVQGIVVGAIIDQDLIDFLGHDLGVAITGHEKIPLTLVLTEGFGSIPMARRTFELLRSLEGRAASMNGATQIRAGVIRPEILVPREPGASAEAPPESHELGIGTPIRLIREPYFGLLATVSALPPELVRIPTGAEVRVLEAQLSTGERVTVPRANVELMQS
jgi:hypothetical protein